MRQFLSERFSISLSRSTCLNYLHRLGFAFKRPKKRLLKADAEKREAFVAEYATLASQAQESGEKIFFADEAHFRADAELRGKWVLRAEPALVDSTSPRYGEKASYYSAVCLETGEVEWMELEGNSNSETLAAFLEQLRERQGGRLNVIWDNAPAHRGAGGAGMAGQARSESAAGEPAGAQPGLQRRRDHLGLGERGGHRKSVLGNQEAGSGEGRELLRWAGRAERGGQASLPDHPAIKSRGAPA